MKSCSRVTVAYLTLVGAEARRDVLRQGAKDVGEIVRLTEAYARAGQGRTADARRAAANADLIQRQLQETEGEIAVASARLAELVNLDPSAGLRTPGGPVQPAALIDDTADLEPLIQRAVTARPEVYARAAQVHEAQVRVRQERVRPFLPTLIAGFSAGGFGGGSDQSPANYNTYQARTDFDVAAVWNVQNLVPATAPGRGGPRPWSARPWTALDQTLNVIRREVTDAVAEILRRGPSDRPRDFGRADCRGRFCGGTRPDPAGCRATARSAGKLPPSRRVAAGAGPRGGGVRHRAVPPLRGFGIVAVGAMPSLPRPHGPDTLPARRAHITWPLAGRRTPKLSGGGAK